jgi:hypothetical protein
MDMFSDLHAVRDLVSSAPVQPDLMADRTRWNALCDGLDGITDGTTVSQRLDALDAVRLAIGGMERVDRSGEDGDVALAAGVAAVRATLEQAVKDFYGRFTNDALSARLGNTGYELEKACEAASALVSDGRQDLIGYNRAFATALLASLREVRDGIIARHYERHVYSDLVDAIYVLDRLGSALDGDPAIDRHDLELLVRVALPKLVGSVVDLTGEIDAEFDRRDGGWYEPDKA